MLLGNPVGSLTNEEDHERIGEQVKNDMEHIRQGFTIMNRTMTEGYMLHLNIITFYDIMVYTEIS